MLKGRYGVGHGIISTGEVAKVIIDLLNKKIGIPTAYDKLKQMYEQVREELRLLASIEGERGEILVVVEDPKEWYIHNAAKAETRGAIIESMLAYLEKHIASDERVTK